MSEVLGRRRARPRQLGFPPVTRPSADPASTRHDEGGLLPTPPTDREKYSYASRGTKALILFSTAGFLALVYSQILMTRLSPWM